MSGSYRFAVLGPFPVPLKRHRRRRVVDFDRATAHVFGLAEQQARSKLRLSALDEAIGCYVFALKPSGGQVIWPYYVGQSCRQTLQTRLFQTKDKPAIYNAILKEYDRAAAYVYLLPLLTPGGRFARLGSNQTRIDNAEHALIGMALRVNYSLWNVKHRVAMEAYTIDGTPQSGRRDTDPAASFRRMLGFASKPKASERRTGEIEPDAQPANSLPSAPPEAVLEDDANLESAGPDAASGTGEPGRTPVDEDAVS